MKQCAIYLTEQEIQLLKNIVEYTKYRLECTNKTSTEEYKNITNILNYIKKNEN